MIAAALWGLLAWAAIITGAIAFIRRWQRASRQLDAHVTAYLAELDNDALYRGDYR